MADGVAIESTAPRRQVMRCDALVGKSILYNWPVVGWCVGQVVERNTDAFKIKFKFVQDDRRRASKSQLPHQLIFYEIKRSTSRQSKQCCAWRTMIVGGFCWQASKRT